MARVVHINLSPPGRGGIERLLIDFLRYFRGSEFDVELCILGSESDTSIALKNDGYRIFCLHRRERRFDWGLVGRLAAHLRRRRCDIVHLHGNPGLTFGVPGARLAGVSRLVYTCHFSRSDHSWQRHLLLGGLLKLVTTRVAVSKAAKAVLVGRYHQRSESVGVIYNGVDLGRFALARSRSAGSVPVVGFCGVFRPEKQIANLIVSFSRLVTSGLRVRLVLVGDGVEMPRCRALVEELGVQSEVTFCGSQTDVVPFLKKMDVFVLPSREEALPVALLEAMASGCAPVASNVGGIPEVVEGGRSGLLVPPDDVDALFEAMRRLVLDDELRARIVTAARDRIERLFSLDAMMEQYRLVYRDLMATS